MGGSRTERFGIAARLDRQMLRRRAGQASFARGEQYFVDGHVRALVERRGVVSAAVEGTQSYVVKLWMEGDELACSCDCPLGRDDVFCKHCVAVALAVLAGRTEPGEPRAPKVTLDDVRSQLAGEDKETLIELLLDRALEDETLRERLLFRAAKHRGKRLDVGALKVAIGRAIVPRDFVEWDRVAEHARAVDDAIATIEDALREGHAQPARELAEHALECLEERSAASMTPVDTWANRSSAFKRCIMPRARRCNRSRRSSREVCSSGSSRANKKSFIRP